MNDEKLIQLVQTYPVLYDLSHTKYMDTEFKNDIWSKLAEEMETTGTSCKTRWSNIRDNYRKSLKKNKTVSGQKAKTIKQYKYSQQLSFLTKFFEERETIPNIPDEVNHDNDTVNDDVNESEPYEDEENSQDCTKKVVNPVVVERQNRRIWSSSKQTVSSQFSTPRKKTKQSVSSPKTAAATVMEYLVKKNEIMAPVSPQHPVDAFLSGISPVLKKLPPRYWHYVKADIFAAVQNYEFKMIIDQEQFATPSPISTNSTLSYSQQPSPANIPSPNTSSDQSQDYSTAQQYYQTFGV